MYLIKKNFLCVSIMLFSIFCMLPIGAAEERVPPQREETVDRLSELLSSASIASQKPVKTIKKAEKAEKREPKRELNRDMASLLLELLNYKQISQDEKIKRLEGEHYRDFDFEAVPHPSFHPGDPEWFAPICEAADNGEWRVVEFLLERGISVNTEDSSGWTPLHYAAVAGESGPILELVRRGADSETVNGDDNTPLEVYLNYRNTDQLDENIVRILSPKSD